ncbi:ATP-dependent nuclease [Megasphaera vaginalis (ex Srinivasan et al. 2021)]|uniref:AAA domain protein n=1 Tax=Megasphaera vaginalis (ex Srinivasan et al. 2021) TaxID=1111454 RepID=U7UNE1_9FIRM|nr:AAA family ATPase [Megasphaera vaginalis (ex Srinivasan et al. 2021)]ERT60781.1 AAA domain protein [Megasphaera vaginalis (ex Srinivasan et al. 2021)]
MKITELKINNFRLFKNTSFPIGCNITVFAGTNAVGKSTLLGLLGNSSELKKDKGIPILQSQFRTEWSEVFNMSQSFDKTASNIAEVIFDDGDSRSYRITWQEKGTRGRIIPKTKDNKSSAKKEWPTLFLGLSRLYPLGEALISEKDSHSIPISQELLNDYQNILSLHDVIDSVNEVHLSDIKRKITMGVNTAKYDYLTNSAGQDNLAQILLAVESFSQLKNTLGADYSGGLLLIDELDAALHPSAQNRLFDYLMSKSKKLNLQIALTTHSLSLLEHISHRISSIPKTDFSHPIELHYLSLANQEETPTVISQPEQSLISNLLLQTTSFRNNIKINVITEDKEARWLLKQFCTSTVLNNINLLDTEIGCESILSLVKGDHEYFRKTIVILDGDVKKKTSTIRDIENYNKVFAKILILPDDKSPEDSLLSFLKTTSPSSNDFFSQYDCLVNGLTRTKFLEENLSDFYHRGKDREKKKAWLKAYLSLFETTQLINFWKNEHQSEVTQFIQNLENAFKDIRQVLLLSHI